MMADPQLPHGHFPLWILTILVPLCITVAGAWIVTDRMLTTAHLRLEAAEMQVREARAERQALEDAIAEVEVALGALQSQATRFQVWQDSTDNRLTDNGFSRQDWSAAKAELIAILESLSGAIETVCDDLGVTQHQLRDRDPGIVLTNRCERITGRIPGLRRGGD